MTAAEDQSVNQFLQGNETASERKKQWFSCFKELFKKKTAIIWIVNGLVFLVILGLSGVRWLSVLKKPAAGKSSTSSYLLYIVSCPKSWVLYEGKCYNFSSTKGTWDFSQRQCSLYNASLASVDTQQDMEFIMRYKIPGDHWFGLRKNGEGQPWKWTNGSIFNEWFNIGMGGFCAYLNDEGVFSARCDTSRNWICTKPLDNFDCEKLLGLPTNTSSLASDYQFIKMNCSVPES